MRKPKYRRHGQQGYGFIEWNCKRHRLPGAYDSQESLEAYKSFCEAISRDVRQPGTQTAGRLLETFKEAIKPSVSRNYYLSASRVLALLGEADLANTPIQLFTPQTLKKFQRHLIDIRLARKSVINYAGILKHAFNWGVEEGVVPSEVWHGLLAVGRPKEGTAPKKRQPVRWADVELTLAHLQEPLCDMVYLQWLTGVRSGSLVLAAGYQFKRTGKLLVWSPPHKTEKYGKELEIPIGPIAQLVLARYLRLPRKKRFWSYSTDSYCKALKRLQEREHLPRWTSHQLRHAVGHRVRHLYGAEAAQALLGHSRLSTTEIYSERRLDLAEEAAWRLG